MPEYALFAIVAVLTAGIVLMLRHEHLPASRRRPPDRQRLDVQNHLGDPDDPTSGTH